MVKRINDRDFEDLIVQMGKKPFAVAFMSAVSVPCEHFKKELAAMPDLMGTKLPFYDMDLDENPTICEELGINAIPMLVIYKDEEEIKRFEGPYSREALKERLDDLLAKKKPK